MSPDCRLGERAMKTKTVKVGIGFATGRKSFRKVLRSHIHSWVESGLVEDTSLSLNIFVAYDLSYQMTHSKDFTNIHPDQSSKLDGLFFSGKDEIQREIDELVKSDILTAAEANRVFAKGYAGQRNAILFNAIKNKMDCLIFLDDDEYPFAVTNEHNHAIWSGQPVLEQHILNIADADYTHGYHCGYISPIPYIEFNEIMREKDFQTFIEAISNDILNWTNVKNIMEQGGITYSSTQVLRDLEVKPVIEVNGAKFISGANLGINISKPERILPFYNPPNARGEDTFLSTCLGSRNVVRVPCYTFHDGFSMYHKLLEGALPIHLKFIKADSDKIIQRFYKACLGWIRYKPLLLYITRPDDYNEEIQIMREKLTAVLPKVCEYFGRPEFMNILNELEKYNRNVKKHSQDFQETKAIWAKVMEHLAQE
jgi:hypothetical protein